MRTPIRLLKSALVGASLIFCVLTFAAIAGAQAGSLDQTFGNGGTFVGGNLNWESNALNRVEIALQNDGKIIVAGTVNSKIVVFRFNVNGLPDTTFGTNGNATIEFYPGRSCSSGALAIQPDGKILVGGKTNPEGTSIADFLFAIARLNTDGSLDASFGNGNGKYIGGGGREARVQKIALQADGKIIFTGQILIRQGPSYYVGTGIYAMRLLSNGSIDNSFGSNGTAVAPPLSPSPAPCVGFGMCSEISISLALQSDGKVVVLGSGSYADGAGGGLTGLHLARFLSSGQIDTSFGENGRVFTITSSTSNPAAINYGIGAVTLQSDGKIVVAGSGTPSGGTPNFAVFRYTASGAFDNSFDGDGKAVFPVESNNNSAETVLAQTNGKIILAGSGYSGETNRNFALARLNADGSLDSSFDNDGKVTTDFGSTSNDVINNAVLQTDGKILVAGLTNFDTTNRTARLAIARYIGDTSITRRPPFDFDGDGKSDVSVFRPSNGFWYRLNSQNNSFAAVQFGQSTDKLAPADYDGDGKTDIAVFREAAFAYFYILNSADNTFRFVQFGTTGDAPLPGDFDGDGKADLAVYRAGNISGALSNFYYRPSSQPAVDYNTIQLGSFTDKPVLGDFDGDGRIDPAIFRGNGNWFILQSSTNSVTLTSFGVSTDIPVPADYDGDGKTNIAVFRPSNGTWYTSQNPATNYGAIVFGVNGDSPIPADYDGDGKADTAVFRPSNGAWYLNRTTSGFTGVAFGQTGDKPIPNAFIP